MVTASRSEIGGPSHPDGSKSKPIEAMLVVRKDIDERYPERTARILAALRDDWENPKRLVAEPKDDNPDAGAGLRIVT